MITQPNTPVSRVSSWIGGIALLLIAVLAGIGNFVALNPLITAGTPDAVAQAIGGAESQFRIGVLCLLGAAVLDVIVAAALLALLKRVNRAVAVTAAWFRVAYSAVFLAAIATLATVPRLVDNPAIAMNAIDAYSMTWRIGLVLFAAHLLLVGFLIFQSRFMPRWLGILVGIAGLGYLVDGIGAVLISDYAPTVSTFTFIGEVALIVWLIVLAVRKRAQPAES
jgi:hypothetical protein